MLQCSTESSQKTSVTCEKEVRDGFLIPIPTPHPKPGQKINIHNSIHKQQKGFHPEDEETREKGVSLSNTLKLLNVNIIIDQFPYRTIYTKMWPLF